MKRAVKYAVLIFTFTAIDFIYIVLAQGNSVAQFISRPEVKYESGQLRDPFQSCLVKERYPSGIQEAGNLAQSKIDLDAFVVQGIIWGGKMPQAIINNKVLGIGDLIENAKILSIDKTGITLSISGAIVYLSAPGKGNILEKNNDVPR
ncbi:MAG: hypothetical protein COV71_01205 [Candidatus Omnitrophica bacterium CG11_big_fil_rev_8_21_14_0_20_41_12]|nr:MAG: hypothetical protein COV71_01205 [Candidatus Omnitrophica bacterium CG11_big_fil_rev_8_21_14_0_20_41_12]